MHVILIKSFTEKAWRSAQTYNIIENSLRKKWDVTVIHTEDTVMFKKRLAELSEQHAGQVFVFNIAEYLDEENKLGFIPAILDEMQLPHLGSNAQAIKASLDKSLAKDFFKENAVPTPASFVVAENEEVTMEEVEEIGFPLIVKPLHEGGHIGIDSSSIVRDLPRLKRAIKRIWKKLEQPAIVEEYITPQGMREFSVGILDGTPRMMLPIEIDFSAMDVEEPILTYELAQQDLEEIDLVKDKKIAARINQLAEEAFDAIGAEDYSRVDIRMNDTGYYVLEINTMPGLGPGSFLPQAAHNLCNIDYLPFIQLLTRIALQREIKHISQ